jgi:ribosome production factor 2
MEVRRTQWAPAELEKQALRRPKNAHYKPKSIKNVRKDGIGDQYGRLHIDKQDLSKLALRRFKTFKGGGGGGGEQMPGMSGASEAAANAGS